MDANRRYLLDANVFIEAHRRYYGFDLCPGFWDCVEYHNNGERLLSIDRVRAELDGEDELKAWVKKVSAGLFISTKTENVVTHYNEVINWVNDQAQFQPAAIAEFAAVADGWLVAYAKATTCTVVTHEARAPGARKRVPIPNVCDAFDVRYVDTFDMLKALEARFHWSGSK